MQTTSTPLNIDAMRAAAHEATALLGVLASTNRLLLLCQLCKGEQCVSDLEELLDLHQPTLSQQLGVLRAERLVATRRDGKKIYYSIAEPRVMTLLGTLYELYCPHPDGARA